MGLRVMKFIENGFLLVIQMFNSIMWSLNLDSEEPPVQIDANDTDKMISNFIHALGNLYKDLATIQIDIQSCKTNRYIAKYESEWFCSW